MRGHTGGRGVHDAVGTGEQPGERVRCRGGGPAGAEVPAQGGGEPGGPVGQRVDDGDVTRAEGEHRVGDGGARAARAQLDDPLQGHVGQAAGEGRREAGDVRVVADRPAVLEDHGVDRAEGRRLRGEVVEVADDELLAGVRDVQPVEADVACRADEIADRLGGDTERVEVDQPVQTAQSQPVGLAFVQHRAERGTDPRADQADEVRGLGHGGPPVTRMTDD